MAGSPKLYPIYPETKMTRRGFKICRKCREAKPHSDFSLGAICRECRASMAVRTKDARPFGNGVDVKGLDAFLRLPVIRS